MNAVRRSWDQGEPSIGSWQGLVSPLEAERLGGLGYDWVLFDLESSGLHWEGLIPLFQAAELGGTRAMVRVPWNTPPDIMRALDYGAIGVVVPMVSNAGEASRAAAATRYPPQGYRANGQLRRAYASRAEANKDVICVVMIETAEGWDKLEEIAATPGVDALMIGQMDLAIGLGWLAPDVGQINIATDHRCLDALERLSGTAARHGKVAGAATVGATDGEIRVLLDRGIRWLGYRPPTAGLADRERANVARWKAACRTNPRAVTR